MGRRYASKLEARYASLLEANVRSGELLFFLRQIPFDLDGGVIYRCDFVEFWKNGEVVFTDVKGIATPISTLKIKQVESRYPVNIQIISKIK